MTSASGALAPVFNIMAFIFDDDRGPSCGGFPVILADYATGRGDRNPKCTPRYATSGQDGSGPSGGRIREQSAAVSGSDRLAAGRRLRRVDSARYASPVPPEVPHAPLRGLTGSAA